MPPSDNDTPVPSAFRKRAGSKDAPRQAPAQPGAGPNAGDAARRVVRNAAGRVFRVEYGGGTVREFKYDGEGRLTVVLNPDGTVWSRNGDSSWTQFGRDGEAVAKWKGHFVVDDSGNFLGECVFD